MIVETKVGNVTLSDNLKVHKFRVNINRNSFKLLYGDLYSDPISALIRELSTNANDSHIMAGKSDVPFEVHLPNELEPFFYVRDFGTGLSPDQICGENGIYITFCDSNKMKSNDFTGCLGLGSKSPLAYTDNFTVESNYNGTKYSYAVFMDEAGEPCITELGSSVTDESNGLKIEMAIKDKDFDTFAGKAAEVLMWFKVRPNVHGHANFSFNEHEYLRKTENYGIRKERSEESFVIMGNVAYPVSTGDFNYNKIDEVERAVLSYGVDLFVDIGDVDFVPSREKLRYTDKTIAAVRKCLMGAIASIREELEKQVIAQPTVWQARCMMNDIKHSILGKVRALTVVDYKGKEICEYINFHKMIEKTTPDMKRDNPLYPQLEVLTKKKENYSRRPEETIYCNRTKIYFNDMDHGGFGRIHKDCRENNNGKNAYLLTKVSAEFLEETGISEVMIKASSLPKLERQKREITGSDGVVRSYVKRTILQEYIPSGQTHMTDWWKDIEVNVHDGGVYVLVTYGQIVDGDNKIIPSEIRRKYEAVKALRPDFKLLGIRPTHMGRIERYKSRWVKFEDYADVVLKEEMPKFKDKVSLLTQWHELTHKNRHAQFVDEKFADYSVFGKFMSQFREGKLLSEDAQVKAILDLNNRVKNPIAVKEETNPLIEVERTLNETYPLMDYIDWWHGRHAEFAVHMGDYIRGIDLRNHKVFPLPLAEAV